MCPRNRSTCSVVAVFMKYSKCVVCGFNVLADDERCQNCGVLHPLQSLTIPQRDFSTFVTLTTVGAVFVPALAFLVAFGFNATFCFALPVCIVSVFLVRATSTAIAINRSNRYAKLSEARALMRTAPHPDSLMSRAGVIRNRISELLVRERQIQKVLARVTQGADEKWQRVRRTLEVSNQTLQRQRARYDIRAIEIELVRLQNKLAPFVRDIDKYSFTRISAHLETIDTERQTADTLRTQLEAQRPILGKSADLEDLLQRLSEIQLSMDKLHDALVGRQAVLALEDIAPLDEALTRADVPVASVRGAEVFNIQVAITDFSNAFDELESEYLRVKAEEDVVEQLDEI
jgi:hypothetical protein